MKSQVYKIKQGVPALLPSFSECPALLTASESELRVLLCAATGEHTKAELAALCAMEEAEVSDALAFWRGAGVLSAGKPAQQKEATEQKEASTEQKEAAEQQATSSDEKRKPKRRANETASLNAEEMAEQIREAGLVSFVDEAEQLAGHIFNNTELSILLGLIRELHLDTDYLLLLLEYYNRGEKKKPLRYIEKVAFSYFEQGIDTKEALAEHLESLELLHSLEGELRQMFGLGSRRLSEKEERIFAAWCSYGYGADVIGAAYDLTVNRTGQAKIAYADKILTSWHEEGVKTVADAEALIERERASRAQDAKKTAPKGAPKPLESESFDVTDFFRKAVARSYESDEKKDPPED